MKNLSQKLALVACIALPASLAGLPALAGYDHEMMNPEVTAATTVANLPATCRLLADDVTNLRPIFIDCDDVVGLEAAVTASDAEVNYNDITTLGTLQASKTWTSDANLDTIMPTGGLLTVQSGGDITLASGSTLDVAGTFEIANTAMTSSAAELNYNDITTLGTLAASKAWTSDSSLDTVMPTGGLLTVQSGGAITANSGATVTLAGTNVLSGTNTVSGATTLSGAQTLTGGLTTSDGDGGNGGYPTGIIGYVKMAPWSVGASVNGTTAGVKVGHIDETPDGEWTATTNVVDSADSSIFRKGTASLKLAFDANAVAGNGADDDADNENWTDELSVGAWIRSSVVTSAGDLVLEITDGTAGATTVNVPAITTANKWTWIEIDISGVANASKDDVDNVAFDLSAAGQTALGAFDYYIDGMAIWDDANEEALGIDVVEDSVMQWAMVTATGGNRIPVTLTEYTNYLIHYEAGNDFFIAIDDQSGNSIWGYAALE